MQLLVTLAVLGLMAGLAWLTVRFLRPGRTGGDGSRRMTVVSKLVLAPRKSLYLVRIDERELILGVSENHMVLLGESGRSEADSHG